MLTGLDRPLLVTHVPGDSGRLFVVEKPGLIYIARDGKLQETPFLDIQARVRSTGSEQGLLGLAFAPDYAKTGYFFVNYINTDGNTMIVRFQAKADNPDQADPTSQFTVLQIQQPASNHNGGNLVFGPDGYLWAGTGDGGAAGDRFDNGQNPQTLLGKMLRLDVTSDPSVPYKIPADNPWVTKQWKGADVRPEIWALGLRNPWRFSFDHKTRDYGSAMWGKMNMRKSILSPQAVQVVLISAGRSWKGCTVIAIPTTVTTQGWSCR